jgi:hypothetical protein
MPPKKTTGPGAAL